MTEPTDDAPRWGILGAGHIAGVFADDLARSGVGRVVAVGSRRQETADLFAAAHGLPRGYGSYQALVDDPEVDVVYVATPHSRHRDDALLALGHGKPALVEKAFTMTAAEAAEVVTAARSRGLFLMEAMWSRFLPHLVEVRRLLAEGAVGEVVTVLADHGKWFPRDPGSRFFAPELGGGALHDLGVYPVSFASMVLGPPDRVVAMVDPAFTGVDGQTSILLGHAGGAQAVLSCTSAATGPTRAAIVGTEGRIEIEGRFYAPSSFTLVPRRGDPVRFEHPVVGRGLQFEAAEVARCLAAGLTESPVLPLDETVSVMATLDAVLAHATNRVERR